MMLPRLGLAFFFCLLVDVHAKPNEWKNITKYLNHNAVTAPWHEQTESELVRGVENDDPLQQPQPEVPMDEQSSRSAKGVDYAIAGGEPLRGSDSADTRNKLVEDSAFHAQKVKAAVKEMEEIELASPDSLVPFEKAHGGVDKPPGYPDDPEIDYFYGSELRKQIDWARYAQKYRKEAKKKANEKIEKLHESDMYANKDPIGFEYGNHVEDGSEAKKGHTAKDTNLKNPYKDDALKKKVGVMTPWKAARARVELLKREVLNDKKVPLNFEDLGAMVREGKRAPKGAVTNTKSATSIMKYDPDFDIDKIATEKLQHTYDQYLKDHPDDDSTVAGQENILHNGSSALADAKAAQLSSQFMLKQSRNQAWMQTEAGLYQFFDIVKQMKQNATKSGDPKAIKQAKDYEATAHRLKKEYIDSGVIDKFLQNPNPYVLPPDPGQIQPNPLPGPHGPVGRAALPRTSGVVIPFFAITGTVVAFASVIIVRVQRQNTNQEASAYLLVSDAA